MQPSKLPIQHRRHTGTNGSKRCDEGGSLRRIPTDHPREEEEEEEEELLEQIFGHNFHPICCQPPPPPPPPLLALDGLGTYPHEGERKRRSHISHLSRQSSIDSDGFIARGWGWGGNQHQTFSLPPLLSTRSSLRYSSPPLLLLLLHFLPFHLKCLPSPLSDHTAEEEEEEEEKSPSLSFWVKRCHDKEDFLTFFLSLRTAQPTTHS